MRAEVSVDAAPPIARIVGLTRFELTLHSLTPGTGTHRIDDASVTVTVPEPATLSLPGLGLFGLAARRVAAMSVSPDEHAVLLRAVEAVEACLLTCPPRACYQAFNRTNQYFGLELLSGGVVRPRRAHAGKGEPMRMTRSCACALGMLLAAGAPAGTETTATSYKTDGASGFVWSYGPSSSVFLTLSQTQTKGADGSALANLSFNAVSGAWPDDFVQIGGEGYVPGTAVTANADRIQVDVDDVAAVQGFYLSGYRCVQQLCESFTPTGPVAVHVTIRKSGAYWVHQTGTQRLHAEMVMPAGTTYDQTQNGTTTYAEAVASGVVAETSLPIENPVSVFASMSLSRGVIVSVTRSQP